MRRESGQHAIAEYLQAKCAWINHTTGVPDPFILR
jgi:hypothetical protein